MPAAARDTLPWEESLQDSFAPLTELELRRAVSDLLARVKVAQDNETIARLYHLIGCAEARLGKLDSAIARFGNATKLSNQWIYLNNLAITLMLRDRYRDALPHLVRASKMGGANDADLLSNIAACLARLGATNEACLFFEQAKSLFEQKNPLALRRLALAAAEVGIEHEAIDAYVRYLRLAHGESGDKTDAHVLALHREEVNALPRFAQSLAYLLRRQIAFDATPLVNQSTIEAAEDDQFDAFNAMRPSQRRATSAVLEGDDA